MAIRKIIKIDEEKCNGCGLCVPNCAEGAIQIINGKAKVVKDSYCDGLGACLGHCPKDALKIIEREADDFNEEEVIEHLKRIEEKNNTKSNVNQGNHVHSGGGCPGSRMMTFGRDNNLESAKKASVSSDDVEIKIKPQLRQWPVQLNLVPVNAPYFNDADLLVTADCVPFAYPNYHLELLKGKSVVIGCPKLDDLEYYIEKLTKIIENNNLKSITVAYMEVPCCQGIVRAVDTALKRSCKNVPVNKIRIGINGNKEI